LLLGRGAPYAIPRVCSVNCWHCELPPEAGTALGEALKINASLTSVSLASNYITGAAAKGLATTVLAKSTLENFSGIPLRELRTDSLTTLDLSHKGLGVPEAMVLGDLMGSTCSLTSVDLSNNALCGLRCTTDDLGRQQGTYSEEGITAIAHALCVNDSLTSIDVRFNNIVGDAASRLSAAVLNNHKIEMFNEIPIKEMRADSFPELDVSRRRIGVEGAMVVAGLIPGMGSLATLHLWGNHLGPSGATAIAPVLAAHDSLTSIDMSINGFGPEGAESIADAVRVNRSLTKMDVTANSIGPVGAKALASALAVNCSLTVTDFRYNNLDTESATMLATIAKERKISICGITPGQTVADLQGAFPNYMNAGDAILLTADLAIRDDLLSVRAWSTCLERQPMGWTHALLLACTD
jgi:Ran GTPase-activating protein (RanGAP) involved in mRNA processing and transport